MRLEVAEGVVGILVAGALAFIAVDPLHALSPAATGDEAALEQISRSGDIAAQRQHVWALFAELTRPVTSGGGSRPLFETWHGEGEVFGNPAPSAPAPGIEGFYRTDGGVTSALPSDVPVLTYTLYNDAAYDHIVGYHLNQRSGLDQLLDA